MFHRPAAPQAYYTMLQAVVMLMLVLRLVSHLVVQPRLSVISATLLAAAPDIFHLVIGPLGIPLVLLGSALCLVFYWADVSGAPADTADTADSAGTPPPVAARPSCMWTQTATWPRWTPALPLSHLLPPLQEDTSSLDRAIMVFLRMVGGQGRSQPNPPA